MKSNNSSCLISKACNTFEVMRRPNAGWQTSRTDRICKYNQLLRIEEMLGESAKFSGRAAVKR